ncbi:glycosyltransferase [Geomonas edaphica]|uniref:glycosyltransferase n=1 Tax=Geomonas edaphica TaxID=2570226 RepID=UPI0010A7AFE5|nr:glycosyltransferase [Geomonas edaphica]
MKTAVFTIVSNNYLAFARTLMQSLAEVHPSWERHVLVVDRPTTGIFLDDGLFTTTYVEELPLPNMSAFIFRYSIMELNTAVKPYMFSYLKRMGYSKTIYLDPDILVLQPMVDVEHMLQEGATAVLTPHLTAPLLDEFKPTELDIMRAGSYNLGFLAVGSSAQSDDMIAWWQRKLEFQAVVDFEKGLFTDQKWLDLAPGMFEGIKILRDAGYNVAYWNLIHRPLTRRGECWYAGESLLRFFHFSGFNPEKPGPFSKHQNRFDLESIGEAKQLAIYYSDRLLANGYKEYSALKYAFDCFDDGTPIPEIIRFAYRDGTDLQELAGPNPFSHVEVFAEVPPDGLPPVLRALITSRQDLACCFPDPEGRDRQSLFEWFINDQDSNSAIPKRFIWPIKEALAGKAESKTLCGGKTIRLEDNLWSSLLEYLHLRWTGERPSFLRQQDYRAIGSARQLLSFLPELARRYFRHRVGLQSPATSQQPASQLPVQLAPLPYRARMLSPGTHCFGFYPDADPAGWWMGREAGFVTLNYTFGALLKIEGVHHAYLYQSAFGAPELVVDIFVNGSIAGSFNLQADGHFSRQTRLKCETQVNRVEVLLVPRQSVIPQETGVNQDPRCLSIQISSIEYAGKQIPIAASSEGPIPEESNNKDVLGVNVFGYVRSEHGLGQSPRLFSDALTSIGHPHVLVDFNIGNSSRTNDTTHEHLITEHPRFPVNMFHINADQMPVVCQSLSPDVFKNRYNVGFWHWELPNLPDAFLGGFNGLNEVWVPSGFVQDAVSRKSPLPVVKIPHAIQFMVQPCCRADFELPEQRFLFLTMYDFSSYQERKNPKGALEAFDRAFNRTDERVSLVIKTQNSHHHPEALEDLQVWLDGRKNVIWLDKTLTRQEVYNLESLCDCYLSLHRSEGFGLGPAEAMFLGKPVIATNWSGTTEFMRQDNSLPVNYKLIKIEQTIGVYEKGQYWAAPDIEHAAWHMRQIVDDKILYDRISQAAQNTIKTDLSPLRIGKLHQDRLAFIKRYLL